MKLFEFDTRDKKPKLYNLLVLVIIAALTVMILVLSDPKENAGIICAVVALFCFFAVLILLYSFREQIRYNPYSYNTVIYFGFALFVLSVMITHITLTVRIFNDPEVYTAEVIIHSLLGSAKTYMIFSAPFLFVFSFALCISNLSLIKHEGKKAVNLLGIILSFAVLFGVVFIFFFDYAVSGSQTEVMIHDLIANLFAAVYLYFECMMLGTMVADAIAARFEPEKNKDFIIILGCGLRKDGTPTPLLQGRIDRAIEFYEKQKRETGKELTFIASGGKGADEIVCESSAIKSYMISRGIPEERIIEEDRSRDTFENMKHSKEIIFSMDANAKIGFSTTNYHVFRSGIFARRVKMRAVGMGAKTRWYFWPNAAVREFAGLLTKHKGKQALIIVGLIIFYVTLTFVAYR